MKIHPFKGITTLAVAATSLAISGAATHAATGTVGPMGDYATIQAAVDDTNIDTILVDPGTYTENVNIWRTVVLKGAQAGIAVAGRTSGGPNESTVVGANPIGAVAAITVNAPNVEIDGFTIQDAVTSGGAIGVVVRNAGHGADILNNIFDGITTPDPGGNGTAQAVYLANGPDNVTIADNAMKNVSSNRSAKGVLIGDNGAADASTGAVITGNIITNITSTTRGAYGISVATTTAPGGASGLDIRENWIDTLIGGGWAHAIGLEGNTPAVIVEDNDIGNLSDLTPTVPSDSIGVYFESNASFGTAEVHHNNFWLTAASFGISVHSALTGGSVDGTCNWWNHASGPTNPANPAASGTRVSAKVSFDPWLNGPAPTGVCVTIAVNKNQAKGDGWKTLVRANGTSFKNQGDAIQYINTGK